MTTRIPASAGATTRIPADTLPSGGGGPEAVVPRYGDVLATSDSNSYLSGAVTMDGDVWVVPVTAAANHQGFNPALKFVLPMPDIMNGTNNNLKFLIEFETDPTGHWSVQLGTFQTSWVGCGGGLEHVSAGNYRACTSTFNAVDVGARTDPVPTAEGCIYWPGNWTGSNNVGGTANSVLQAPSTVAPSNRKTGNSAAYDRALSTFVIAVNHRNTSSATETLRFKVKYWLHGPAS